MESILVRENVQTLEVGRTLRYFRKRNKEYDGRKVGLGGTTEERMLQGQVGIVSEILVNLDKEFGHYPPGNEESLNTFKQGEK